MCSSFSHCARIISCQPTSFHGARASFRVECSHKLCKGISPRSPALLTTRLYSGWYWLDSALNPQPDLLLIPSIGCWFVSLCHCPISVKAKGLHPWKRTTRRSRWLRGSAGDGSGWTMRTRCCRAGSSFECTPATTQRKWPCIRSFCPQMHEYPPPPLPGPFIHSLSLYGTPRRPRRHQRIKGGVHIAEFLMCVMRWIVQRCLEPTFEWLPQRGRGLSIVGSAGGGFNRAPQSLGWTEHFLTGTITQLL